MRSGSTVRWIARYTIATSTNQRPMPWLNHRRAAYVIDSPPHSAAPTSNATMNASRTAHPCQPLLTNHRIAVLSASSLAECEREGRWRGRPRKDQHHDRDVDADRNVVLGLAHRQRRVRLPGRGGFAVDRGAVIAGHARPGIRRGRNRVAGGCRVRLRHRAAPARAPARVSAAAVEARSSRARMVGRTWKRNGTGSEAAGDRRVRALAEWWWLGCARDLRLGLETELHEVGWQRRIAELFGFLLSRTE